MKYDLPFISIEFSEGFRKSFFKMVIYTMILASMMFCFELFDTYRKINIQNYIHGSATFQTIGLFHKLNTGVITLSSDVDFYPNVEIEFYKGDELIETMRDSTEYEVRSIQFRYEFKTWFKEPDRVVVKSSNDLYKIEIPLKEM